MKKHFLSALFMAAISSMATAQDITSNLEAHISFDNGNATIDAGAATVAGIINGATSVSDRDGNPNSAMYFDGGDWIDFGNYSNYQFGYDSFTIACWMKADATGTAGYVIGKRGFTSGSDHVYGLTYNYTNGGQVLNYLRDDNSNAATYPTFSVAAGQWHHVAIMVDRTLNAAIIYVDGTIVAAQPLPMGFLGMNANGTTFGNLVMGRASNGDQYFKGWVDEVRIYRRALSEADMSELFDPQQCVVNIPDAILKTALVNNSNINTNSDTEIQCSEAANYTGYINVATANVADLTGIEAFTSAVGLDISFTDVTSFDITPNVSLTYFNCTQLGLTGTLIFNAANAALQQVFVGQNQLSGLDVTALSNLNHLNCAYNNSIASLDLSANPALGILAMNYNAISSLDLSNNLLLADFSCAGNDLSTLDLSQNSALATLNCEDNSLNYLNVANGTNTNVTSFNALNNPDLTCIQVDDAVYSTSHWPGVSGWTSFNESCISVGINEATSSEFQLYPNPTSGFISFTEPIAGQLLDVTGKILIQFPNTRTLDLSTLADGVYLIRSNSGAVSRIVKN
ncbi:MAG: T9SS type A sorting domain-containing protein [Flavobacteriales bacterium]|jgi:hypothetical protein|nr:T9SS type A sorting domain-containing protein [Flavobacteriales bacterium]